MTPRIEGRLMTQLNIPPSNAVKKPIDAASKASANPQAAAAEWMKDDTLAQSKGDSPEHRQARQRVARLFCELHLPDDAPADRDARLAAIDYACPVVSTNARGVDVN